MDFPFRFRIVAAASFCISLSTLAGAEIQLGPPPVAPTEGRPAPHLDSLQTGGFTVDTTSREQTRAFYNAIYPSSENVEISSTSDVEHCIPGATSTDFRDAVLRRINWHRAMAGVPANIQLDATFNAKDQAGALMMSANAQLSHSPPADWSCWSSDGTNAAANSNLALGSYGPEAVDGYMRDPGSNNDLVGHRRWLLYPQTQVMGTGDIPQQESIYGANAIWVLDGHYFDPRPSTRDGFVAWPPPGYVPVQIVVPRWSFSFPKATFTTATVSMKSNGIPVSVKRLPPSNGFGENTLVWVPMGLDPGPLEAPWPFNGSDTVYSVAVSNVLVNSQITNFVYTVVVFNPAIPGTDYVPASITGPAQPAVGQNNSYSFPAFPSASGYQWRYSRRIAFNLFDGAEGTLTNFTADTTAGYPIITTSAAASGTHSFQLAHLTPEPQLLTLNYTLVPHTNSLLQFKSRLGVGTSDQVARVQFSTNDGAAWFDAYAQAASGVPGESSFTTKTIPLDPFAGTTLQLRFNYDFSAGSYYTNVGASYGWHLDNIVIANVDQLFAPVTNNSPSPSFLFNPPSVAVFDLQARAVLFNDFPLEWGPTKSVTSVVGAPVITLKSLELANGQLRIPFTVQGGSFGSFKLLYSSQPSGVWQVDPSATLIAEVPGSAYRYTTTASGAMRFYRVQGQ